MPNIRLCIMCLASSQNWGRAPGVICRCGRRTKARCGGNIRMARKASYARGQPHGRQVGEIIARSGGGLTLDVGCGALALPVYMAASSGCAEWIGVDPFLGDAARQFPFVQGVGSTFLSARGV